jgi:hypothetical protein
MMKTIASWLVRQLRAPVSTSVPCKRGDTHPVYESASQSARTSGALARTSAAATRSARRQRCASWLSHDAHFVVVDSWCQIEMRGGVVSGEEARRRHGEWSGRG